jgi:hypothetical protein
VRGPSAISCWTCGEARLLPNKQETNYIFIEDNGMEREEVKGGTDKIYSTAFLECGLS